MADNSSSSADGAAFLEDASADGGEDERADEPPAGTVCLADGAAAVGADATAVSADGQAAGAVSSGARGQFGNHGQTDGSPDGRASREGDIPGSGPAGPAFLEDASEDGEADKPPDGATFAAMLSLACILVWLKL